MLYIHAMKYYLARKKDEVLISAAAQVIMENTMLTEMSQTQKDTYYIIALI